MLSKMRWIRGSLLTLGLLLSVGAAAQRVPEISQQQLLEWQASANKPLLVDVRSAEEYQQGHVPGAINIPHDQVKQRLAEFGDKNAEIVLYCRSGRRTGMAVDALSEAGYTRLKHLQGDMNAWQDSQLPIEK